MIDGPTIPLAILFFGCAVALIVALTRIALECIDKKYPLGDNKNDEHDEI